MLVSLMVIVGYLAYDTYRGDGLPFREVNSINSTLTSGADGADRGNSIAGCGMGNKASEKLLPICAEDRRGVVLVVDNPALPNPQDCVARRSSSDLLNYAIGSDRNEDSYVAASAFNNEVALYRRVLEHLQKHYPRTVRVFDPTSIYCDKGICGPMRDGRLLYSYTDHISDYAAGLVAKKLNRFLSQDGE